MKRSWQRRTWLGGAGAMGLAGLAAVAYRMSPSFWNHMATEASRPVDPAPAKPHPRSWPDTGLHAAWLGHSTVLLKIDGYTILTDPILSERAGIGIGPVTVGIKRLVAPAIRFDQLPKIDLILLSHAHMDHFDLPTLRRLEGRQTAVITAASTSDLLRVNRYRQVTELRWGERARVGPVECLAFEVKHWGARFHNDTYRGYNGYFLEAGGRRILFAGDTAWTDSFRALRASRPVDLAIMPIGAYNPWIRNHCTPEQAWRMGNEARTEFFIPVHHQTFRLSREPVTEPIERFCAAAGSHTHRVAVEKIGGEFRLA